MQSMVETCSSLCLWLHPMSEKCMLEAVHIGINNDKINNEL